MERKKIELHVLTVTVSQEQAGAYALVLQEAYGQRQLPVIIGSSEAQTLLIMLKGIVPSRPLTHTLFASVLSALGVKLLNALIYRVDNGIFYTYLFLKANDAIMRVDSRTSDAVALAMHMNAPILIYEDILEAERIRAEDFGNEAIPHRVESLDIEALEAEMQQAIEEENYERAAQLRDLIKQHDKHD